MVLNLFRLTTMLLIAALVTFSGSPGVAHKDLNMSAEGEETVNVQADTPWARSGLA